MNRESLLAAGAVTVVVALLVAGALVPGILASPTQHDRPARIDIVETTVAAGDVGGETATLELTTYLRHHGGTATNVTVRYRATDLQTGLVTTTETVEVGTLESERERPVNVSLEVPREGGYRIETTVYVDGQRREEARTEVRGVGSLQPDYAKTPIAFHRFDGTIPSVEYRIADVTGNRTTLNVSAYLTNQGDEPAGDLRLTLTARQAESGIVADRASIPVGEIRPGRTVTPSAALTVPDDYNYYLDAVLWKDGVIVGTARAGANLDPTRTISVNQTRESVGLEVGDFERDRGRPTEAPQATGTPIEASQPGFGLPAALTALTALSGAALLVRRWDA
ncbi:DUF7490 domain-containing protein [Natronomonas sp. EA1]|uniref:DUF7490 domain-containing protein n=1 Tax=Natronomonas sp. EA1 TaxID=3421655 RepID=UPI003EB912D7